jgi:hypothetical protein
VNSTGLQLTARVELGDDAFEHAVAYERASERSPRAANWRAPSITRAISGADRTSSTASSSGRREARAAALAGNHRGARSRVGEPWPKFVVVGRHHG